MKEDHIKSMKYLKKFNYIFEKNETDEEDELIQLFEYIEKNYNINSKIDSVLIENIDNTITSMIFDKI